MRLTVRHETVYRYPRAVINSVNEVWLRPLDDERQGCLSFALRTTPPTSPRPYTDYFGNTVYHFDVPEPHEQLVIFAEAEVETADVDGAAALAADRSPFAPLAAAEQDRWLDFLQETPLTTAGPRLRALTADLATVDVAVGDLVLEVFRRTHAALRYTGGSTLVSTSAEEALALGAGVCQDYTHISLAALRALGIPARYVSGYLCTGDGSGAEDQRQASHAWPEVLLPAAGWIPYDPTNGCLCDGHYVRVAIGRDYSDVPPVRGAYSGPTGNGVDVSVFVINDQQQQQ